MSRTYTRIFSDVAYKARMPSSEPSIVIGTGMMRVIPLKVGSEGRITQATLAQDAGDAQVAFVAEILKSTIPWPELNTDLPVATAAADFPDLYRAVPQIVGVAGFPYNLLGNAEGYAAKNMDGTFTNSQQFLYLVIIPTAAGAPTHWKFSITLDRDVG